MINVSSIYSSHCECIILFFRLLDSVLVSLLTTIKLTPYACCHGDHKSKQPLSLPLMHVVMVIVNQNNHQAYTLLYVVMVPVNQYNHQAYTLSYVVMVTVNQ